MILAEQLVEFHVLIFLVGADVDGKFVGFLSAKRGNANRIRNTAYVVVGIIKEFQHQGIGSQLFEELERWAKEKAVKRLELTVMINNYAAIALFQKHGFTIEAFAVRQCVLMENTLMNSI